jgi:hypothetical protein
MTMRVVGELGTDGVQEEKQLKVRDSDHLDPGYKLKKNFEFPKAD